MRNKGEVIKRLDEINNTINLCISGLSNRSVSAVETKNRLNIIRTKLKEIVVLVNTNNETP